MYATPLVKRPSERPGLKCEWTMPSKSTKQTDTKAQISGSYLRRRRSLLTRPGGCSATWLKTHLPSAKTHSESCEHHLAVWQAETAVYSTHSVHAFNRNVSRCQMRIRAHGPAQRAFLSWANDCTAAVQATEDSASVLSVRIALGHSLPWLPVAATNSKSRRA